jgi:hypothetical protein
MISCLSTNEAERNARKKCSSSTKTWRIPMKNKRLLTHRRQPTTWRNRSRKSLPRRLRFQMVDFKGGPRSLKREPISFHDPAHTEACLKEKKYMPYFPRIPGDSTRERHSWQYQIYGARTATTSRKPSNREFA